MNGDPSQIDLPNKQASGLDRAKKLLSHLNEISVVDFDHTDVVRHPLVSKLLKHILTVMIKVNVLSEDKSWSKKLKKKRNILIICVNFFQKFQFTNKKVYFTLLLSNNKNIKKLNKNLEIKINIQIFCPSHSIKNQKN